MRSPELVRRIVKSFLNTDRGAALVDYTLVLSLLVLAMLAGISMVGSITATSLG